MCINHLKQTILPNSITEKTESHIFLTSWSSLRLYVYSKLYKTTTTKNVLPNVFITKQNLQLQKLGNERTTYGFANGSCQIFRKRFQRVLMNDQ